MYAITGNISASCSVEKEIRRCRCRRCCGTFLLEPVNNIHIHDVNGDDVETDIIGIDIIIMINYDFNTRFSFIDDRYER